MKNFSPGASERISRHKKPELTNESTASRAYVENGKNYLRVVFDLGEERIRQTIDLMSWRELGPFSEHFARGFLTYGLKRCKPSTRRATRQNLENGFIEYCKQRFKIGAMQIQDLDTNCAKGFKSWLDKKLSAEGKPLNVQTKRHYFSALRSIVKCLKSALKENGVVCEVPKNPWPETGTEKAITEPLPTEIYMKCISEVAKEAKAVMQMRPMIERFYAISKSKEGAVINLEDAKNEADALNALLYRYGGQLPEHRMLTPSEKKR